MTNLTLKYNDKSAKINVVKKPFALDNTRPITKYDFSFENLDDLVELLSLSSNETVYINDLEMTYGKFKKEVLSLTHRIYLSKDSRTLDHICY